MDPFLDMEGMMEMMMVINSLMISRIAVYSVRLQCCSTGRTDTTPPN